MKLLSQLALPVTLADQVFLDLVIERVRSFPADLIERATFPLSYVADRFDVTSFDRRAILAGAYYGFYPLSPTYDAWCQDIDRVYRVYGQSEPLTGPDGRVITFDRKKDKKQLQDFAAREFGFQNREELKQFYKDLDALAKSGRFGSYQDVCDTSRYIELELERHAPRMPDWFAPTQAELETYAMAPPFLWNFAMHVKSGRFPDVALEVYGGWVLYVHQIGGRALARAFFPPSLRHGAFERPEILKTLTDSEGVLYALLDLAKQRYPGAAFELVPEPVLVGIDVEVESC